MTFATRQLSARLPVDGSPAPPRADVVRELHRWIQTDALDELLIDVVDYGHVHGGPGVLLITGDGEYSFGDADGGLGLRYLRKRDAPGPLADKLRDVLGRLLAAAALLERALPVRFRADELIVRVHDRLLAPNHAATLAAARPALDAVTAALYGGTPAELTAHGDPRQLFAVRARADADPGIDALRARLAPA